VIAEADNLVCYLRNPLNNLSVIPGKLAIASATRNPGISKTSGFLRAFAGMTGRETLTSPADFSSTTLASASGGFPAAGPDRFRLRTFVRATRRLG
jgi:hypothetical protein